MSVRSIENFIKILDPYNPTRSYLLGRFGLDRKLVRASGHYLYDEQGTAFLDFAAQFGTVSLGHNHPELCDAVRAFLGDRVPAMVQPLVPFAAQDLAGRLAEIAPGDLSHCVFTNSGAEAVEAGIKLARAQTRRRIILSTHNGFHGKTLGALSATGNAKYQKPFGAPVAGFEYVPFGDIDALAARLGGGELPAAFIVEPIQAEGGVIVPPAGYLASAIAVCRQHGVLSILDEIQTGLGRTGDLFALPSGAGAPDILLLAKALGGGLFPIGACICSKRVWDHEFGYLHSSTFANNNLGCTIGAKVLEILLRDDRQIIRHVAAIGDYLIGTLQQLRQRYPRVIKDVRGRGLLVGLEFQPFTGDESYVMSYFSSSDYFVAMLCGFLFNEHHILAAPVLNRSHVLRLEPPFTVEREDVDDVIAALGVVCDAIDRHDFYALVRYLIGVKGARSGAPRFDVPAPVPAPAPARAGDGAAGRFAFLMHPGTRDDVVGADPSLAQLTPAEELAWYDFIQDSEVGVVYHVPRIASPAGSVAEGWLMVVSVLAERMLRLGRPRMIPILTDAVALARDKGARILGLGGFTSILTNGGSALTGKGVAITSGSCLTAAVAVDAVEAIVDRLGASLDHMAVAIVGATGAIGRLVALQLAPRSGSLLLAGNPASFGALGKCQALALELERAGARSGNLHCHDDLQALLPQADVVIVATSSHMPLVDPSMVKAGAIVCDISRPRNVAANMPAKRGDVIVFEGGLVEFPGRPHLGLNVQHFPRGVNLACLAEAVVLALEGDFTDHSIGNELTLDECEYIRGLARKHGFTAAGPHWAGDAVSDARLAYVQSILAPSAVPASPSGA